MSKPIGKIKYDPLNHPSPDFKNKSKIQGTTSPVRQVKLFLQNAKKNQKENQKNTAFGGESTEWEEANSRYTKNQEILRKRISDLQLENNEFRSFTKDYQDLVERNKRLEEQMMLLLEQLQEHSREEGMLSEESQQRHSIPSKDQFNTNQSTHSHHDGYDSKLSPNSQDVKVIKSFDSYDGQQLQEDRQHSNTKAEDQRIQDLINSSIKAAIQNLQDKFMKYIFSMEQKLAALAATNIEISQLRLREEDDSSKSSNPNTGKLGEWEKRNQNTFKQADFGSLYVNCQNSGFSLNPNKTIALQSNFRSNSKGNLSNSKVEIEYSSRGGSSHSFANINTKTLYPSPESNETNLFKHVELIESEQPIKTLFQETIIQKIYENLSILKSNLLAAFNGRQQTYSIYLQGCSNQIESQLKDCLRTFFCKQLDPQSNKDLIHENEFLRTKIIQLTSQISNLRQATTPIKSLPIYESKFKPASQRYLQQSYYRSLESQEYRQFQQSKRKLIEVIDIIKGFNRDYRYLLSSNECGSLMIQSIQKKASND